MLSKFWPKLAAASLALIFCVVMVEAWRADRRDRAQLAAELASTKQLLAAANVRQRDRDTQLAQTLSALDAQKRAIVTPAQIVRELPKNLPLPTPITLQRGQASPVGSPTGATLQGQATVRSSAPSPDSGLIPGGSPPQQAAPTSTNPQKSAPGGAFIPRADLKPLYDYTLDCQACQARLSVAQHDLADEKTKPRRSPKSAMAPCASPMAAAPGAGSLAPRSGSSSQPQPAPSLPKPVNHAATRQIKALNVGLPILYLYEL